MKKEILADLGLLFAIISKQDNGVTESERQFVIRFFQLESNQESISEYIELYDRFSVDNPLEIYEVPGDDKIIPVKDVVNALQICRRINRTLEQRQKIVILMKLLDMACSYKPMRAQAMEIITMVSRIFNIDDEQFRLIRSFVTGGFTGETYSSPQPIYQAISQ